MAIAGDIKLIFNYLVKNKQLTDEIVEKLQDKNYCAENFASGKYPVLLKYDKTLPHQEQRKYGTQQARYYDPQTYLITYKQNDYLFTSELYEDRRSKFYTWIQSYFGLNGEEMIKNFKFDLKEELKNYIGRGFQKELLEMNVFHYQKARDYFGKFSDFGKDDDPVFFEKSLNKFLEFDGKYQDYYSTLTSGSKEKLFFEIIGKVIAHIDFHAFNKNIWNENQDKHTVAKSGVRQGDWVKTLIKYRISGNNILSIKDGSIKKSILYVLNPDSELTMLSDNHREMFSTKILHKEYNSDTFVNDFLRYFESVNIPTQNLENKTAYICLFLYDPDIKNHWIDVSSSAKYWLLGAYWKDDVETDKTQMFIEDSCWINGFSADSGDSSLETVKKIEAGDFVAIKSSFTVKDEDGKTVPCLRIKAIGEVLNNHGDGVNLDIEWIMTDAFDIQGLSYRKTAELVRGKDKQTIFDFNSIEEDISMKVKKIDISKNTILFGPPGTGKTYKTISKAIEIANPEFNLEQERAIVKAEYDRLVDAGQIVFTTFHQSMSYEDFIEGIKPVESEENDTLNYTIELGIFRKLCIDAAFDIAQSKNNQAARGILDFSAMYDKFVEDISNKLDNNKIVELKLKSGGKVVIDHITEKDNIKIKHLDGERKYTVSKNRLSKLFATIPNLNDVENINSKFREIIGGSNSSAYWAVFNAINENKDKVSR